MKANELIEKLKFTLAGYLGESETANQSDYDLITEAENYLKNGDEEEKQLKREEKAGAYLCSDSEFSIKEQIELIEQANDLEDIQYIDDVEGVQVWEKLQNEITTQEFLDIINS